MGGAYLARAQATLYTTSDFFFFFCTGNSSAALYSLCFIVNLCIKCAQPQEFFNWLGLIHYKSSPQSQTVVRTGGFDQLVN